MRVPATLNSQSVVALAAELEAAISDGNARVVVLHGSADNVFCQGLDLAGVRAELDDAEIILRAFAECLVSLRLSTKPTVAAVDGATLGGGVGIASACDVVIATSRSVFGLPELLLGLAPLLIWPLVLERVPPQKARLLALKAASVPAAHAGELGLVDSVVEPDALNRAVNAWTRRLSRADADAVGALKRHMAQNLRAIVLEGAAITTARLGTPGVQSMLRALEIGETAPWLTE